MINNLFNKYKKLSKPVKASFWFLICGILTKAVSFFVVPVLTRILSKEEYGLYTVLLSWEQIIIIFTSLNLFYNGYNVGLSKFSDDIERYTSAVQGLYTTITLIWIGIYIIFSQEFNIVFGLKGYYIVTILVYLLFSPAYEFWAARQRFVYEYKKLVLSTIAIIVITPVFMISGILSLDIDHVLIAIIGKLSIPFMISVIIYTQVFKAGRTFYCKKYWHYSLRFNIPLLPYYLSLVILNQLDKIMISHMCSNAAAAIYSVVYSASLVLMLVNNAVNNTMIPWMIQKLKSDKNYNFSKAVTEVTSLIFSINILLIIFGPEFIKFLAPKEYFEAVWMIPPIALSVVLRFMYQQFVNVEFYFEKTSYTSWASIGTAFLDAGLNYIFIRIFGYMAAAYTTFICYTILTFAHYYFMKKLCKKNNVNPVVFSIKSLLIIIAIMCVTGGMFLFLYQYTIYRYLSLTVFILVLFLMKNKIRIMLSILGKANKRD